MTIPWWVWITTLVVTIALLLVDVVIIGRHPHVPSMRECTAYLVAYVSAAVLFGCGVWFFAGGDYGGQFFAGWLTEYSLSVDNLFIFIIIMAKMGVPERFQQSALMVGIIIALVLRAIFIALGAVLINQFAWVFYLFGLFLIYTAYSLAKEAMDHDDDAEEYTENAFLRWAESTFPATSSWKHGTALFARENTRRLATPMFFVILALGTTDVLFALDSIPAIFGLTQEPFLVLTANIFALMGLRQLYFLIGGLLKRLVYLGFGLSILLAFIGVKLILHALHENNLPFVNGGEPVHGVPEISTVTSLAVIIGILTVTTVASLVASRRNARKELTFEDVHPH